MSHSTPSLFDRSIIAPAVADSFRKLDPRLMVKNPVMFVTLIGAVLTTVAIFTDASDRGFVIQLAVWLWFTVLFANFAEAVAEGRGKAQADSLRKARKDTMARRLKNGKEELVAAPELQKDDVVVCETNDVIPADGEVIEGIASVDEAAITGKRFLGLYPASDDAAYAAYMVANSYYNQIPDTARDQDRADKALMAFREVVERWPKSEYVEDSRYKITVVQDQLAGREMDIARFYLKKYLCC